MKAQAGQVGSFQVGTLKIEIYSVSQAAGEAAAQAAAAAISRQAQRAGDIGVIFATGASQINMLRALTAIPGLPWSRVVGFHMDEYENLQPEHPASFRGYLRERLTSRVSMKEFNELDCTVADLNQLCREYTKKLHLANPQLCLLGIGENGHLAFNDPPVADFNDPEDMKVVMLDAECKQQQYAEGWFKTMDEIPERAVTLTIPALFRVPRLIASVPGPRKARIVYRALTEPITTACPATLLRMHQDCTVYLDQDSASDLKEMLTLAVNSHEDSWAGSESAKVDL
jgi:glucosamine-6-phosphate deaminase